MTHPLRIGALLGASMVLAFAAHAASPAGTHANLSALKDGGH